ncbi:hypothetical protein RB195_024351 [Necator americanus]|uniref:Alpha-1,2-Mannosidase n=1 Tax=Necator americanus TaxID=51031 RepID=A0ABR1EQ35_NECAM
MVVAKDSMAPQASGDVTGYGLRQRVFASYGNLSLCSTVMDSINDYVRVPCGFAGVKDVRTMSHEDRMDSFVLSETFKYLYMIFAEPGDLLFDPDNYVLTTEAHFLPLSIGAQPNDSPRRMFIRADDISSSSVTYIYANPFGANQRPTEADEAMEIRERTQSFLEELFDVQRRKPRHSAQCIMSSERLHDWSFSSTNAEHVKQLLQMGIQLHVREEGRMQLSHHSTNLRCAAPDSVVIATTALLALREADAPPDGERLPYIAKGAVVQHIAKAHNLKVQLPEGNMESLATTIRFVTLNSRTLSNELQQAALSRLLRYLCVPFAALQETRMRDRPVISIENYTIYCGDADENKWRNLETLSRHAFVRLRDRKGRKLWVVSAHASTETPEDNTFYDELNALLSKIQNQEVVIVGIDANAKIRLQQQSEFYYLAERTSDNGDCLVDICEQTGLIIASTCERNHQLAWQGSTRSPREEQRKRKMRTFKLQLDYVLTRNIQ